MNRIRIQVLTTTRAEYGAMRPIIRTMEKDDEIDVSVLVTGTHLLSEFGNTISEIERDGFRVAAKIPIIDDGNGDVSVSRTMGNAISRFGEWFHNNKPDLLLLDGDRDETLAICIAAVNSNIPVMHLGGGTTTEGAADEYYRHAITKLSYIHFATIDTYRKRIIQMGEDPKRVFLVGSPLIENILDTDFMSKDMLGESLNFPLDMPFSVVTFHPVTLEQATAVEQVNELIAACSEIEDMKFIFTMANADNGGELINKLVQRFADENRNVICVPSLGSRRYLSALKCCDFVMGNSSSGIIEAPSFKIPTINIGDRQKGRIQAKSVINCSPVKNDIIFAINKARSKEFKNVCLDAVNPNGDGNSSVKIIDAIKKIWNENGIHLKKSFYNIPFEVRD